MAVVDEDTLVVRDRDNSGSTINDLGSVIGDGLADGEGESTAVDCALVWALTLRTRSLTLGCIRRRAHLPTSSQPLDQADHSTPKPSLIRAWIRHLQVNRKREHRHTVRVINPLLDENWADTIDHNDGVLVDARDLFDECILRQGLSACKEDHFGYDKYPAVPCVQIIAVACVVLDREVPLTTTLLTWALNH